MGHIPQKTIQPPVKWVELIDASNPISADVDIDNNCNAIYNGGSATTISVDMEGASNIDIPIPAGFVLTGRFTKLRQSGTASGARSIFSGHFE